MGKSINEGIPKQYAAISYTTSDEIYELVLEAGRGATIIKKVIKSAFRIIPVAPSQR